MNIRIIFLLITTMIAGCYSSIPHKPQLLAHTNSSTPVLSTDWWLTPSKDKRFDTTILEINGEKIPSKLQSDSLDTYLPVGRVEVLVQCQAHDSVGKGYNRTPGRSSYSTVVINSEPGKRYQIHSEGFTRSLTGKTIVKEVCLSSFKGCKVLSIPEKRVTGCDVNLKTIL